MPRQMPPLAGRFSSAVGRAVGIAEAGEIVRAGATRRSVAFREFRQTRLEALHEMAYLRIFVEWELFLEATFLRTQCGYLSAQYTPVFTANHNRQPSLAQAQAALYAGQQYLLWHNPNRTVTRAQGWFVGSPHELVTLSNLTRLEWFASLRHGIAHGSDDVRRQVNIATGALGGRTYTGSACGKFLRDWDRSIVPNRRWLHSIASELQNLARQIAQ
jgi:hypothetical protein